METRTSYVLVGAFLLAAAVGLIAFIVWSVKSDTSVAYATYRAYFAGSVSGLTRGSEVRYRGIPIGRVTDIRIDPDNVELIRVTMDIVSTTPIKTDSVATVQVAGITGVGYVQIEGGSQGAPPLQLEAGRKFPVIQTKRSGLEALFDETPELIQRVIVLTDEVTKLFSEENRTAITETLDNVRELSSALSGSSTRIAALIDDTAVMAAELRVAAEDVKAIAADARTGFGRIEKGTVSLLATAESALRNADGQIATLGNGATDMIASLNAASESLTQMSTELREILAENRKPLHDFSSSGLYDFTRMIAEMRGLVSSLSRISERLESDPSLYLFGGANQGYEAK